MKFLITSLLFLSPLSSFAQNSFPTLSTPKTSTPIETLILNSEYEKALDLIENELKLAKKKRKSTELLDSLSEVCEERLKFLKGTDQVLIVDSLVIAKSNFLAAFNISSDLGTVRTSSSGEIAEYETERANQVFRPERNSKGELRLYSYYKENGKELYKKEIQGLDVDGDLNYPFLMTDGVTFYFAARAEDGLGNYDIYATRYDADSERFYKAENMGYPYNSYANDYLMVIDDEHQLGWFASDRYQPDDKVCIYTFVPNSSRHTYDYESTDHDHIIAAATLRSIKKLQTKKNEQARIQARQRLSLSYNVSTAKAIHEFTLVINDNFTYHNYSDFNSPQAKDQCHQWQTLLTDLTQKQSQLDQLRLKYATTRDNSLRDQIITLEADVESLSKTTKEAEKLTRKLELGL